VTIKQRAPVSQNDLDFSSLPLHRGVVLLQKLGLSLLQALLTENKAEPVLSQMLDEDEVRLLRPVTFWTLRRHARSRGQNQPWWTLFPARMGALYNHLRRRPPGYEYQATVKMAAQGRLSLWAMRARLLSEIERRMGGIGRDRISPDWWPLIGVRAWLDPHFQYQAATLLRTHLHHRMLFALDEIPLPHLSPQTLWLLVALANPVRLRWWQWLHWDQQAQRNGLLSLQRAAAEESQHLHWAHLWDQWIVSEALQHWPGAFRRLPGELRYACYRLPLVTELSLQLESLPLSIQDSDAIHIAHPDWRHELPGWLPIYYRSLTIQLEDEDHV
jgi:hypothetical protein